MRTFRHFTTYGVLAHRARKGHVHGVRSRLQRSSWRVDMSYNLQAEGLNGVNVQTSIIAGHDWVPNLEEGLGSPESTVLFVSGVALDIPSPANIDAISGRLVGNGVTGFGGDV